MENAADWIEHLEHPLVLAGFGLFVLAVLLKPIFSNGHSKLSGRATERLMSKAINMLFILALLVIVSGFVLSLKPDPITTKTSTQPKPQTIQQTVSGTGSNAITAGGNVNMNNGGVLSSKQSGTQPAPDKQPAIPSSVKQTINGNNSNAINAAGDVSINNAE